MFYGGSRTIQRGISLVFGKDHITGRHQGLRPGRTQGARAGDARCDAPAREHSRRTFRSGLRFGRGDHRAAHGIRLAARQDRLRHLAPVLSAQDADGPCRGIHRRGALRRGLGLHESGGESARLLQRRTHIDLDQPGLGPCEGTRSRRSERKYNRLYRRRLDVGRRGA